MLALRLAPVFVAFALLGAHFYRGGMFAGLAVAVALIALLLVPRVWAARTVQAGLVLGAVEWLRTAAALIAQRESMGAPYLRLALILGAVAVLTACSLVVFRTRPVRVHFGLRARPIAGGSASDAA